MTKPELISLLIKNHNLFVDSFVTMDEKQFTVSVNGKWNSCQQLDHIIRAVQPVVLAFTLPSFLIRLFFGKANRPSKTYEGLVEKYQEKLAAGGRATGRFVPKGFPFSKRESAMEKLDGLVRSLTNKIKAKNESELDGLLLPHPLLGKLTLREMLYFTAYHAEHHSKSTAKNLNGWPTLQQ